MQHIMMFILNIKYVIKKATVKDFREIAFKIIMSKHCLLKEILLLAKKAKKKIVILATNLKKKIPNFSKAKDHHKSFKKKQR